MPGDDARKDVFPKIVAGLGILGVSQKNGNHELGIEDVDAH